MVLQSRPNRRAPGADDAPVPPGSAPTPGAEPRVARRARSPYAATVNLLVALALVALTLVFIAQNSTKYGFEFLWMDFTLSAGLAMLISAVAGAVIALLVATGLVVHSRRRR